MSMILVTFVRRYLNWLANFVEGEACMVLGVKDDLRTLQRRLERLRSVLDDAKRKRIQDDQAIKTWVMELKDVMYDADDIFDLSVVEGSRLLEDHDHLPTSTESDHASVYSPFSSLFSCISATKFRYEIGKRIKSLNRRLKEIAEDSSSLSRLDTSANPDAPTAVNTRQTSPLLDNSDNIAREDIEYATQRLVMLIIREEEHINCRVFGIIGMDGIGKTTLAHKIYDDDTICNIFSMRIWVCISQIFNEEHLLQQMIRSASGSYGNATTFYTAPYFIGWQWSLIIMFP